MTNNPSDPNYFARRVDELRLDLASRDPKELAHHSGAMYQAEADGRGIFTLDVWQQPVCLSYPDFRVFSPGSGTDRPLPEQALLLYYFSTADGSPQQQRWVSFTDLPNGKFYNQAFQGYSGGALSRAFGNDSLAFESAAERAGGARQPAGTGQPGDLAFRFQALPRLPLLVVLWQGDEDFPSSFQVLFDASASHYLPSDVCAILGGMLARRIIKA